MNDHGWYLSDSRGSIDRVAVVTENVETKLVKESTLQKGFAIVAKLAGICFSLESRIVLCYTGGDGEFVNVEKATSNSRVAYW